MTKMARAPRVVREADGGYGEKLMLSSSKFVEVSSTGATVVYGYSFTPDEIAVLIRAAYLLGKEQA